MWRDLSRLVDSECKVMVHGFTLKHFSGKKFLTCLNLDSVT